MSHNSNFRFGVFNTIAELNVKEEIYNKAELGELITMLQNGFDKMKNAPRFKGNILTSKDIKELREILKELEDVNI